MNNLEQFENMTIGQLRELTKQNKDLQRKINHLQGNTKINPKEVNHTPENLNMEYYIDEINRKDSKDKKCT